MHKMSNVVMAGALAVLFAASANGQEELWKDAEAKMFAERAGKIRSSRK